jgi:hypothetical protein
MRKYEGSHIFHHSWHEIATAFWKRYPNKFSKHVLSEDVIDRKVNPNGELVTRRLFVKTNSCPKWVEKIMKTKNVQVLEESFVDPFRQTLTNITRNLGMTNLMSVEETCVYKPHPENKVWTVVERKTNFESKLTGIRRMALLTFGIERYKYNIRKTDTGFQQVIKKILATKKFSGTIC